MQKNDKKTKDCNAIEIEVDTHTHTTASVHAYSTLKENVDAAAKMGLKGIAITDHTPAITGGSAPIFIISSVMKFLPEYADGIRIIKGMESNILDYDGNIDVTDDKFLKCVEFGIASIHNGTMAPGTKAQHTDALIGALSNPNIKMLGHIGDPRFEIDKEAVVKEAKRLNKIIEINNHSFEARAGSGENCTQIARLCKKHGVRIAVSSDAHSCYNVGKFEIALKMLDEIDFPEELVVNAKLNRFLDFLKEA